MRAFTRTPATFQFGVLAAVLVTLWFGLNWIYQVVRKPSELFFPVSGVLYKLPDETWDTYESVFRKHSTGTITPAFLAALAQIEAIGQSRRAHLLALVVDGQSVRPLSAGVERGRHVPDHRRYIRRVAALLHPRSRRRRGRAVARRCTPAGSTACIHASSPRTRSSSRPRISTGASRKRSRVRGSAKATLRQKEDLAAVIHLCGAGAGERYARRGLRLVAHQRCGDHDVRAYLNRVQGMKTVFLRLGADS